MVGPVATSALGPKVYVTSYTKHSNLTSRVPATPAPLHQCTTAISQYLQSATYTYTSVCICPPNGADSVWPTYLVVAPAAIGIPLGTRPLARRAYHAASAVPSHHDRRLANSAHPPETGFVRYVAVPYVAVNLRKGWLYSASSTVERPQYDGHLYMARWSKVESFI
jgi:hypothetical protein